MCQYSGSSSSEDDAEGNKSQVKTKIKKNREAKKTNLAEHDEDDEIEGYRDSDSRNSDEEISENPEEEERIRKYRVSIDLNTSNVHMEINPL